jgi:hypothetical protein
MRYLLPCLRVCASCFRQQPMRWIAHGALALLLLLVAGCGLHDSGKRWTPDQCLMLPDGTECVYFGGQAGVCIEWECEERCTSDAVCNDHIDCTADACDAMNGLCSNEPLADSTQCSGGQCQNGTCALSGTVLPCTEQGIRNAVHAGGGPYTFACDGPTTVTAESEIPIGTDVILDGEGNLTLDGKDEHRIFAVSGAARGVQVELWGFTMTRGTVSRSDSHSKDAGGAISNAATLTLHDCTVSGNATVHGGGIQNSGTLTLIDSTVSDNRAEKNGGGISGGGGTVTLIRSIVSSNAASKGGGILGITVRLIDSTVSNNTATQGGGIYIVGTDMFDLDPAIAVNSTVSGNAASTTGGGIFNDVAAELILVHTTVAENTAPSGSSIFNNGRGRPGDNAVTIASRSHPDPVGPGLVTVSNSVLSGQCGTKSPAEWHSKGHNIESPGDTCGFDQGTDQVDVTAGELNLGPLRDNGGLTETHALLPGSVAINKIPAAECVDADGQSLMTDQRGQPRPEAGGTMCDVGAFEVQP